MDMDGDGLLSLCNTTYSEKKGLSNIIYTINLYQNDEKNL